MGAIDWVAFNWIDYAVIIIIVLSLLIGVVRGFVSEVISIITWVAAFLLAFKYAPPIATHLTFTDSPMTAYVIAFAVIFVLVLVFGITTNVLIRQLWHRTGVPAMDRILGLLLGIVRGVLIIAFILLFIWGSPLQNEPKVKEAQLLPLFTPIVTWLRGILPEKVVHFSEWSKQKKTPEQKK